MNERICFIWLNRVVAYDNVNGQEQKITKKWLCRIDRIESFEDGFIYLLPTRYDGGDEIPVTDTAMDIAEKVERAGGLCV